MITAHKYFDAIEAVAQTFLHGAGATTLGPNDNEISLTGVDLETLFDDATDPGVFDPADIVGPLLGVFLARADSATVRELNDALAQATGGRYSLHENK